jgi:hypothetical protein
MSIENIGGELGNFWLLKGSTKLGKEQRTLEKYTSDISNS